MNPNKPSIDYATGNVEYTKDADGNITGATVQYGVYGGPYTEHRMSSMFARLSYNYNERYMIQATIRRDGSSRFGINNKYGTFPSVSVGWNVTNEEFMADTREWLSNLKVRASWGKNGNDNIAEFGYTSLTAMGNNVLLGKDAIKWNGSKAQRLANPDLKWEESEQTDLGIDLGFFNNALTFSADYYIKKTNGMIITMPIPSYVGETKPLGNVGDMENSGFEFELGYKWNIADAKFAVKGNATYLKNELKNLGNDTGYMDVNGNGSISADDRTNIGNGTPDWTYGLNLNADWKGFDFNIFFQGVAGADVFDGTYRTDVASGNYPSWMLGRWTGEGTSNKYPRLAVGNATNWMVSDLYVCDGSYLRLKNITLGNKNYMKTNKILAIGLLAAATVLTTGCSDSFLEVENPTGEPLEDYYTTDEHIQEALIAAYDPLHWPDWGLGQYNALNIDGEIMGDNFWVGGATKTDMQNWHMLFNYEANENNTLGSLWTVDYSGIKRCNDLLKYLDWGTDVTEANRKLYEMQARLLRVFYYNMLWHYFGNVPFYLENLSEPPYTAPQYTADQVYAELIAELEAVIDSKVLPLKYYKTIKEGKEVDDEGQLGRVTQAMAYMVYAEMVMYQNDESRFSKALGYMKELIDSPSFRLNPSFANIWETEGEWCDESIWEINYEQTNNERGWGSPLAVGGTVLPTLISPNSFPGDDGWSKGNDGWGFMPMRLETYQMFSEQDKRRDATCWVIAEDVEYTKRYQDTHIWLQKYRPYDKNFKQSSGDQNLNYNNNYRYYRYAETLLNAAELSLRTGGSGTGEAKTWLNEVRTRAGLAGLANVTVDDVLTERRLEFVGEGKRYFDLVRAEGISGASASNKATTALVPDEYGYRTNSWTAKKKYIPIAQGELDSDPALVQNAYK